MMHEQDAFLYRRPVDRLPRDGDELDLMGETPRLPYAGTYAGFYLYSVRKEQGGIHRRYDFRYGSGKNRSAGWQPAGYDSLLQDVINKWSNAYTVIYPGHDGPRQGRCAI